MSEQLQQLVKMANQIALNFGAWGDEGAVAAKTAEHLRKFWTPAMLATLAEHARTDAADLSAPLCGALALIEQQDTEGETTT